MDDMGFVNTTLGSAAAEEHRGKEIVDPFKRLPDAIVSHILDKVSEAKYLCRCSLVSKRFSSLVYKSESVSFKIPVQIPIFQRDPTPRLAAFPGKLVHAVTYPMGFLQMAAYDFVMRTSSPPYCAFDHFLVLDYLPKFLRKFTRLKSLVVEFDYSASGRGNSNDLNFTKQPALKWTFDSNSWCFILVMTPRSIDEEGKNIYAREADLHKVVFDIHFGIFVCTCTVMGGLFRCLPESVARVVITDSKKQGKIGFGQADLMEITSQVRPFMTPEEESKFLLKIWEESTLEELQMNRAMCDAMALLPSPDMKVATFFLCKAIAKGKGKGKAHKEGDYDDDDDDYLEVKKAFKGPQAACLNAVMEMLKEIRGSF